ncbi:hypothetical protein [Geodermatophilus sp. URMC 65]
MDKKRRTQAPENELPVGIEPFGVLGRSDQAVVTVTGVQVFSTGLGMDVTIVVRERSPGRSVAEGLSRSRRIHVEPEDAEDWLWLDVAYADGRPGSNAIEPAGDKDDQIFFVAGRASSSGRTTRQPYWLSPLPPAGALTFSCTWPRFDITETKTVVDTAPILAAASRVEVLWPAEPDRASKFLL